jgi:hypothetical protein
MYNIAVNYANIKSEQYPELKDEIMDLLQLCQDEIDEGGSESHEIELFIGSVDDLIEEQ